MQTNTILSDDKDSNKANRTSSKRKNVNNFFRESLQKEPVLNLNEEQMISVSSSISKNNEEREVLENRINSMMQVFEMSQW